MWLCASFRPAGRSTLLDVIEDFANEIGVGDVFDDRRGVAHRRAGRGLRAPGMSILKTRFNRCAQESGAVSDSVIAVVWWFWGFLSVV